MLAVRVYAGNPFKSQSSAVLFYLSVQINRRMATNFYRTPRLTTYAFAAGLLLFLLPFAEIRCNGLALAHLKGIDMATGASPNVNSDFEKMSEQFGSGRTIKTKVDDREGKVYAAAIIALALGVAGLAVSLTKKKIHSPNEMLLGILGAAALLVLLFQVKSDVNTQLKTGDANVDALNGMMKVSVDFTFWFYLCLLSFLAAAFFSYQQKQLGTTTAAGDNPPPSAPQTPLHNPGDQSNFPASPSGQQDLG